MVERHDFISQFR